ncbi:iron-sulfur cluster assembly accessory protein [Halomonas sp. MCCC 1A17488]|uniref:Iron-sulfur cluster assembly accessory protein n=1 Tax=Billgrantia sulfidoxydans TaxID=2733484 RepID=A0ABX7W7N8_9GAMM|nr:MULTISPECIES: iron-sulfur cluster assembly accessory protein [Halomonas]MCE8017822.1 iron-sulfur cluster assembly accessory protein [Halomonas sp. MCCC 1A17488]MCG3241155.1 iron-sulfur cluster assembly accessory protein [Halomonas sp. MCCC 1A17488]QPP49009.1 iron-sulfur cluster assembly accessory protein [Halomonas sp. SS10-MC5]QTP56346.1 iron-sulfur cluster assembly accessory protein [Halomonas sulfidoxydans]
MAQLSITTAAAEQIQRVLEERGQGLGLRVSVKPSGCSGYSYVLDFADEAANDDAVFEEHGVTVFVAPEALPMLDGSEVDYVSEGLNRFFRFNNPNVKDQCGCGESFTV